jgi:hypothetical protein
VNFIPVGWLDTFELAASLRQRMGRFAPDADAAPGRKVIPLRGPAEDSDPADDTRFQFNRAATQKWPELRAALERILRVGKALGGIDLGRIELELVSPGAALPWRREVGDYVERYERLHLALRTNPGAIVYSGNEGLHLLVGAATIVARRGVPTSAVNMGESPRIHLVVDFRRKENL